MSSTSRYPQLVAFDLDYTLWDLWIDTHVTGPLHRNGDKTNEVLDRHNDVIAFYKDVPPIFHRLKAADVCIAACSRTSTPDLAYQALRLLLVPPPITKTNGKKRDGSKPVPAIDYFDQLEIYPGSKITHFKKLHEKTGIPYSEMLFFDDEHRNKEVGKLGVTFQIISSSGLTNRSFEQGLSTWAKRNPEEEAAEE
ncbi:magnesium-dependent phosphatase-1 [Macrolepiota fuliginosa MF-IS2]|uniref:Magnesium-dependent phosphatase-1 n=1 Tax=Macrolepiota fuliginosa MF-IS2 TaxID=1400762 RepID=A0A9P6C1G2_9AGAR|nr:magnesium-dependent phosphatase-1 [Macrolepiota fuliginosa MF-IS2]